MSAKAIMVQGTASHVGKSLIAAALCRIFADMGLRVAPFKSQNMALNSFVTSSGGEMGRAQVAQAEAARVAPNVDMNPILLKPNRDKGSQVIIHGRPVGNMTAQEYYRYKDAALRAAIQSYRRLAKHFDVIVMEGAGSPAEINIKENDIVNMKMAEVANAPVILVADIDRGGVFASILGTLQLLEPRERTRVCGIVINKFRGDISILETGIKMIEARTKKRVLGVLPYREDLQVDQEDSLGIGAGKKGDAKPVVDVAVIRLPRISNFTDFDALAAIRAVGLRFVPEASSLGRPDMIILPGTKQTIHDLQWLMDTGLGTEIVKAARAGTMVVGICGGYQMLGRTVEDPDHAESDADVIDGLGLLNVSTIFKPRKTTHQVKALTSAENRFFEPGQKLAGYEIHMGESTPAGKGACAFEITSRSGTPTHVRDGCINRRLNVFGTYIHGLFDNDAIRFGLVNRIRRAKHLAELDEHSAVPVAETKESRYSKLAELVAASIDMSRIYDAIDLRVDDLCPSK
jgi:adenosylcobyric acid synthase